MIICTCGEPFAITAGLASMSGALASAQVGSAQLLNMTLAGTALGSPPGAPGPVRFYNWAPPEFSGQSEVAYSTLFKAAAVGISTANGVAQANIAEKQQDLANSYYAMAKSKWDRFYDKYRPLELKLLDETSTAPVRYLDCAGAESRTLTAVNTAYEGINDFLARKAKVMRLCLDPTLLTVLDSKKAVMRVDAENYNLADDRWYTDFKNDQRWNRRSNILNLGRNLTSEALKYGQVARAMYGAAGQQIDRAAGGAIQAIGYYGAKNDTNYPTTYLAGQQQQLVSIGSPENIDSLSSFKQ